jgi:hypothetical protein
MKFKGKPIRPPKQQRNKKAAFFSYSMLKSAWKRATPCCFLSQTLFPPAKEHLVNNNRGRSRKCADRAILVSLVFMRKWKNPVENKLRKNTGRKDRVGQNFSGKNCFKFSVIPFLYSNFFINFLSIFWQSICQFSEERFSFLVMRTYFTAIFSI